MGAAPPAQNSQMVGNTRIADMSIDQLLALLLDAKGFAARKKAVEDLIAEQDRAREELEAVRSAHDAREAAIADKEEAQDARAGALANCEIRLAQDSAAFAADRDRLEKDLALRESALVEGAAQLKADQGTAAAKLLAVRENCEVECSRRRSAVEAELNLRRKDAAVQITQLREQVDREIRMVRSSAEQDIAGAQKALADRERIVNEKQAALDNEMSRLKALLPTA